MCRAFATLGHDPGVILLDAAACQMVDNIVHFRPQVWPLSVCLSVCLFSLAHTFMPGATEEPTRVVMLKSRQTSPSNIL